MLRRRHRQFPGDAVTGPGSRRAVLRRPTAGRRSRQDQGAIADPLRRVDDRINAGWPAYEAALQKAGVNYEAHTYPGVQHGFNNDTTPRYDAATAKLAWDRTIAFFNAYLRDS
ncbi:dienelactone hydrolase family protein [Methylomonas koyamae]|uniref:dienelactone hydrolase family protein n=1 Tax=Methylomonas koyamae TaxID=702114 RepID=UPI000A3E4C39|nr:dienelactone hydrolase family protein [Methylomonas koyamae]